MNWLNYHHLYYFYIIAREGGVTEATHRLKLAQSTLSAQLKQFEEVVGYKLFERRSRKLFLTDVGRRVFDYAHEIFSLGEELRDSLGNLQNSMLFSLKVGIMDSIPKRISCKMVDMATKEKSSHITIIEGSLPSLSKKLAAHEIDLIIANDKPSVEKEYSRFHAKLIGDLAIVFVANPSQAHLKKNMPQSLNNQPIVMPGKQSTLRVELLEHFKIKHIQPTIIAEVDDLELQKMLILQGHGFGALARMAVEKELKSGELVQLSETPLCHENLWIITTHRLVHNPLAKLLISNFRPTKK